MTRAVSAVRFERLHQASVASRAVASIVAIQASDEEVPWQKDFGDLGQDCDNW